jgi:hypothetical protein
MTIARRGLLRGAKNARKPHPAVAYRLKNDRKHAEYHFEW